MLRDELIPITQEHEYLRIAFTETFFAGVTRVTFGIFRYGKTSELVRLGEGYLLRVKTYQFADSGYWRWWCMLGDGYFGDYGKWFVLLYDSLLVCCGVEAVVFEHKLVKANGIVVEKWLKIKV
ncbi:hypothetical protein HanRHA438_Chr01g0007191 [Helianthus annuus]|nr:hypothetical protein HanRHA438_Chr01g0007191 [Helianthus annuus]KAJ0955778.1 hypothetical protein HanPSC8_Chr01g0006791 [Helianthus annuus]